ncbi:MAG: sodium:calcium antiporter [Gammaproteobacteria bacterium]|jgi:cation:H+ antiporter
MYFLELALMLLIILLASELFTNALEHLGEQLKISEGVTGSVFAAVGTAMPETLMPLVAIFAGGANIRINEEIGVGAILGSSLMLSTLSLFLVTLATLRARGTRGEFRPEPTGLRRDLNFFLFAYGIAAVALFVPHHQPGIRLLFASILVVAYFIYLLLTLRASATLVQNGHGTDAEMPLMLSRIGLPENRWIILLQLLIGLALLIAGARGFVHVVENLSDTYRVSALLIAVMVIPIATELPEKVNSILWARRGKDTLAFGNITGAMVFQGTLLPAIGIMLTPWVPRHEVVSAIVITLAAALWTRLILRQGLKVWHLFLNGALYLLYLGLVLI